MAQKRNPISLRLQTRLQGYEKRFASCWFTDSFFSQVCTNDLFLRLYCGYLLQKGGSWYGETSESRIPETCISLQFSYRRCFIVSAILDGRREEYTISNPGVRGRRQDALISLQPKSHFSYAVNAQGRERDTPEECNNNNSPRDFGGETNKLVSIEKSLFLAYPKDQVFSDEKIYLSAANIFGGVYAQYKGVASPFSHKNQLGFHLSINDLLDLDRGLHNNKSVSCYHIEINSPSISLIESICNFSQENKEQKDNFTSRVNHTLGDKIFAKHKENDVYKHKSVHVNPLHPMHVHAHVHVHPAGATGAAGATTTGALGTYKAVAPKDSNVRIENKSTSTFVLPSHWTSLNLVRGVSAVQSVEFCLHSVVLLYRQRFSFLKIKETLFKKLACNPCVRGARLVCSGRQGGRSKSAMRAKKQSATLGNTKLSLFSSRLAFTSASIDTTFGQIGIKLWICYK